MDVNDITRVARRRVDDERLGLHRVGTQSSELILITVFVGARVGINNLVFRVEDRVNNGVLEVVNWVVSISVEMHESGAASELHADNCA